MQYRFKILSIAFCCVLCMNFAHAQVRTLEDTLSVISPDFLNAVKSQRGKRLKTDSLYLQTYQQNRLSFVQQNITQLLADTLNQVALLQLNYQHSTRAFKLPTQAHRTRAASLYTEGFTTIGRAKIMGKFYFDKIWEDSLANNLSGDLENGQPFTFFATKAGKYERQNIKFEAGIGYKLVNNLYLQSAINYNYHWTAGSVDPRPQEKIFHITYKPGLSYTLGKYTFGANYLVGKVDGTIDIGYKNRMFSTSQLYPDRRLYINNGYGYIAQLTSEVYSSYKNAMDGWGVQLATHWWGWQVKACYTNEFSARKNFNLVTNTDSVNHPIRESAHSRYELLQQQLSLFIQKEKPTTIHQISFNGMINEGTAQLTSVPTGANYLFDEHKGQIGYLLSLKNHHRLYTEWGFDAAVNHFTKRDFLAQHFYENTNVHISLNAGKYWYGNYGRLKVNLKPQLMLPIKNELIVPATQVTVFTKKIAYAEYDFWGSTLAGGQLNLDYYTPGFLKLAGSSIMFNIGYCGKLKDSDLSLADFTPSMGKNQFNISIGFKIFL